LYAFASLIGVRRRHVAKVIVLLEATLKSREINVQQLDRQGHTPPNLIHPAPNAQWSVLLFCLELSDDVKFQ
jgi:hypothetical protein